MKIESQKVSVKGASKFYGEFKACNQMNLEIEAGEFFTLLGPSGCGKTTLLRMIAGFNSIDEGEIYFNEKRLNDIPAERRNIGLVFQNYAIFPHLTVRGNVEYGLRARRIRGAELKTRADEAMEMMQILELAERMPSQLSGGQQQRVALARAIVIEPDVLLMDEPLSNLDAKLRVTMRTGIRKIQKRLNITTIYVTHDQEEALSISDRIAVIDRGEIRQVGTPKEIYMKPRSVFVANFIGTSFFLEGELRGGRVRVLDQVELPPLDLRDDYEGAVLVALRPENISLVDAAEEPLQGVVNLATFLGDYVSYEVELSNGQLIEVNEYAKETDLIRAAGSRVGLSLKRERIMVFEKDSEETLMR